MLFRLLETPKTHSSENLACHCQWLTVQGNRDKCMLGWNGELLQNYPHLPQTNNSTKNIAKWRKYQKLKLSFGQFWTSWCDSFCSIWVSEETGVLTMWLLWYHLTRSPPSPTNLVSRVEPFCSSTTFLLCSCSGTFYDPIHPDSIQYDPIHPDSRQCTAIHSSVIWPKGCISKSIPTVRWILTVLN